MDRETLTRDSVIALLLHLQIQTSASQHSVCMSLEEFRQLAAIGRDWLDLRARLDAAERRVHELEGELTALEETRRTP